MSWSRKVRRRIQALFRGETLDARMHEEMRSHLEMQTQEFIEAGLSPAEARHAALRQFGSIESIKEICRDQRGVRWLENLVRDLGFAVRTLRKSPGLLFVAVMTRGVGVGGSNAL